MAWERRRNGKIYYYAKRRTGGAICSEYIGSGYPALLAEQLTERAREEADRKRQEWQAIRDEQARLDQMVDDFGKLATSLADAALLLSGHRQHKRGEWRKRREQHTG